MAHRAPPASLARFFGPLAPRRETTEEPEALMHSSRRAHPSTPRPRRSLAPLLLICTLPPGLPAAADFGRLAALLDVGGGSFEGQTLAGRPQGEGRLEWADGRVFVGEFFDGVPDGKGELTWPDGMRYRGPVVAGQIEGEARVEFADGRRYRGPFVNGMPEGLGTFRWPDRSRYTGEYVAGQRHGWGEYKGASGERYVGGFARGARHGQGTLIAADGTLFRGNFRSGQLHGFGVRVSPKGRRLNLEYWENGALVTRDAIRQSTDCHLDHGAQRWMVQGTDCENGRAHGVGNAVSTDGLLFIRDGRFDQGRLVAGRPLSLGQPQDVR